MPDDYKTKRQTSDYFKKNIKKIIKDIVICLSHFIVSKLPICYSVEKNTTIPLYIQSLSKEIQNRRKVGKTNEM